MPARGSWHRLLPISPGGRQYVTVMVGWGGPMGLFNIPTVGPVKPGHGCILTFALDESASLAPRPYGHTKPPSPAIHFDTTAAALQEGALLYHTYCWSCHGANVVAGPVPDLRYSTADVHAQFDAIVRQGARKLLGMPAFSDKLNPSEVRAIQANVLSRGAAK